MNLRVKGMVAGGTLMAAVGWVCLMANGQEASSAKSNAGSDPVHSITLPQYPAELPAGAGKEAFQKNCLICHSARYVAMQPGFTKAVWQAEVQKMIAAYGAQIAATDKDAIVEYLVTFRGVADSGPTPQEHAGPK